MKMRAESVNIVLREVTTAKPSANGMLLTLPYRLQNMDWSEVIDVKPVVILAITGPPEEEESKEEKSGVRKRGSQKDEKKTSPPRK